jgi:selenocysteine lyase/cysteine desulfurase
LSNYRAHFSRFLSAEPDRLHLAAHSHHPWPDVSYNGHMAAWFDAAELADDKWDKVFGEIVPEAQRHVAGRLGLSDPTTIAFAPSTHTLLMRLLSCLPQPLHVLTTDAEFHSFTRQMRRLEEDRLAVVTRMAAEPFGTFPARFAEAAAWGGHDLVYLSHVHYNSGYVTPDLGEVISAIPADALVVVDGYHGFMAVPTDVSGIEERAFYLAGGYKYAMSGEGACFMHCPPGYGARPANTGWFAGFGALTDGAMMVDYAHDGRRFAGATFEPSGLYRMRAVFDWLASIGVTIGDIHAHVQALQARFVAGLDRVRHPDIRADTLIPATDTPRGHFLTFRTERAGALYQALLDRSTITDHRGDRLRLGFALYHDPTDVDALLEHLATLD